MHVSFVVQNYVFSLLTGYFDPPPGMEPMPDLHYNAYFPGSWIGMAKALYSEIIEYDDGKQRGSIIVLT